MRTRFADGRATLSANLFYNDISNAQREQQTRVQLPDGSSLFTIEIANAPKAESYGAELELSWRPTRGLSLQAGAGLLKTKILRTSLPTDPLLGKAFPRAPRVSANIAVDWRPIDALRLSTQVRANGGYYSDGANNPALRIKESIVVNGRAAYSAGGVTFFGYARNIFDNFYLTYLFTPTFGTAGDPREFGIGIEARF